MVDAGILIVEDEVIIAMGLERALDAFGYNVVGLATKAADGIRMTGELKPDLVLIDINLKDSIDGIEVARRIGADYDIPVVYLTSYTDDEILKRAIETNPYGYLIKPARPREIYTTIETVLQKHRAIMAERAVIMSESKLQLVLDAVMCPVCIFTNESAGNEKSEDNAEWKISCANSSFIEISGIDEADITSVKPDTIFGEGVREFIRFVSEKGSMVYLSSLTNQDGGKVIGKLCLKRAEYNNGKYVVGVFIQTEFEKTDMAAGTESSDSRVGVESTVGREYD